VKPPAFDYSRPATLDEALEVLAELGPDGKVLAGGQSLLPILSMRLAAPKHLLDINRISELSYVRADPDGVRVGALARHATVERDTEAASVQPLLAQALRMVAHPTIRNRGTTVGSIVHADPAGEMPAILCLLGGTMTLASASGRRVVPGEEFFLGPLESAVLTGELAIEAYFPSLPDHSATAFLEVSRRHGDYALCGVGVVVSLDADLRIDSAKAGYLSVSATPLVIDLTDAIRGKSFDGDFAAAGVLAQSAADPEPDIHATAAYRRQLVRVLTTRALQSAASTAANRLAA
jgi:carbon-monoxide dehydrogenase medium subunit